jgi:hypothetical protein
MADESMFEGVSIFDAAANENTGIRDRALNSCCIKNANSLKHKLICHNLIL